MPRSLCFAIVVLSSIFTLSNSQQCRSYSKQAGNCVSIQLCPPLLYILKNNPSAVQLRQLQRLTCGFGDGDPKVCCPLNVITSFEEEGSPLNRIGPNSDLRSHPGFSKLPDIKDCGIAIGNERIIGGKNASLGSYPWMARIGYKAGGGISTGIEYYCGGTIIGKRWILTAAHCTDGDEDEYAPVEVRVGEHDTETELDCDEDLEQCSTAEDYKIKKLLPHKDYSSNSKQNDISLIKLDRDIDFDNRKNKNEVLEMAKYKIDHLPDGEEKGIVAGWGRTQWNKAVGSKILQEVTVPLKSNKECQAIYSRRVTISAKQLCAGGESGQDSCGGDSGGPIMYAASVQKLPHFFQLGVVSYGPVQCGIGGLPGVYARTSAYLRWILDTIAENE